MALDTDILDGFKEESNDLLAELLDVTDSLEEKTAKFPAAKLEEFSQKIDRIMGAAKTLLTMEPQHAGLDRIGKIAELCKKLGYHAAKRKDPNLIPIFAGFWADTLEVLEELVGAIDDEDKSAEIASAFSSVVTKRLEWLASKVVKADVKAGPGAAEIEEAAAEGGVAPAGKELESLAAEDINSMNFDDLLDKLDI